VSYKIDIISDGQIILLTYDGRSVFEDARDANLEIIRLGEEKGIKKFLHDCRKLKSELTIGQIYDLPKLYDDLGISRQYKVAIIIDPQDERKDDYYFLEDASVNRGYQVRICYTIEDGKKWLG